MRLPIRYGHDGRPTSAKTKMPITITQSKKAVPQRGWIKLNFCTLAGESSAPASSALIALCSARVVLEHAPEVGDQPDQRDVGDEHGDADQALDDHERARCPRSGASS